MTLYLGVLLVLRVTCQKYSSKNEMRYGPLSPVTKFPKVLQVRLKISHNFPRDSGAQLLDLLLVRGLGIDIYVCQCY